MHVNFLEHNYIKRNHHLHDYKKSSLICKKNDQSDFFAIIKSGTVEIKYQDTLIQKLNPGDILGEMALFNHQKRTYDMYASTDVTLLHIKAEPFMKDVLHQEPGALELIQSIGEIIIERIQAEESKQSKDTNINIQSLKQQLISEWSLKYHQIGSPGKIQVISSKPCHSPQQLAIAYSPGVAEPCIQIEKNPQTAYQYTSKGHLVGVISNGSAVLGLGNIGALASKPVMEGKAILFKQFANLDAFDIEINESDPKKLVDIICSLEPTFGGINLEDIKSPECFYIEQECQRRMNIPVFHDDQHGTAIIIAAGLLNSLEITQKSINDIRVVFSGIGAAGYTCAKYLLEFGLKKEQIIMTDINGVLFEGRDKDQYYCDLAQKPNYEH